MLRARLAFWGMCAQIALLKSGRCIDKPSAQPATRRDEDIVLHVLVNPTGQGSANCWRRQAAAASIWRRSITAAISDTASSGISSLVRSFLNSSPQISLIFSAIALEAL